MSTAKQWDEQEDVLIQELVKTYGTKQWATIATELYKRHGFKKRTGKQCRQRWHNHLDPEINKNPWSQSQEKIMFQMHKIHGNKWTIIAENLPGRTDNAIKNHFYSTIRRSLRRISKIMGSKNSTKTMRDIKPSTLSLIFSIVTGKEKTDKEINIDQNPAEHKLQSFIHENCQDLAQSIMQFANYKPTKKRNKEKSKKTEAFEDNGKFQQIMQKMLTINHLYEKAKGVQRRKKKDMMIGLGKDYDIDSQSMSEELSDLSPEFIVDKREIVISPRSRKIKLDIEEQHQNQQESEVIKLQHNMTRSRRNIRSPNYYEPTPCKKKHRKSSTNVGMQQEQPMKTIKTKPKLFIQVDEQQQSQYQMENKTVTKQSKNMFISPQSRSTSELYIPKTVKHSQLFNSRMQEQTRRNNKFFRQGKTIQNLLQLPSMSDAIGLPTELEIHSQQIVNQNTSPRVLFISPRGPTPKNFFNERMSNAIGFSFHNEELENALSTNKRQPEQHCQLPDRKAQSLVISPRSAFMKYKKLQ